MARHLYDFICPHCCADFEELVGPDDKSVICPECGKDAERQLCAPTVDWRPFVFSLRSNNEAAIDKWDRKRKKKLEVEHRKLRDHGTYE